MEIVQFVSISENQFNVQKNDFNEQKLIFVNHTRKSQDYVYMKWEYWSTM